MSSCFSRAPNHPSYRLNCEKAFKTGQLPLCHEVVIYNVIMYFPRCCLTKLLYKTTRRHFVVAIANVLILLYAHDSKLIATPLKMNASLNVSLLTHITTHIAIYAAIVITSLKTRLKTRSRIISNQ